MTPTYLNWFDLIRYLYEIYLKIKLIKAVTLMFMTPENIKKLQPLKGKDKLSFTLRPLNSS